MRADDFHPYEYLLRVRSVLCTSCNRIHRYSELMLVRVHGTLASRTGARQLEPVEDLTMDLPVSVTHLPERKVGVCHHCLAEQQAAPRFREATEAGWAAAIRGEGRRIAVATRAGSRSEPASALRLPADLSDVPS